MAEALKVMIQARTVDREWRDADEKFHAALLEASGNDFLTSLTSSVNAAISWSTIFKQRHEPLRRDPVPDHRKVYLAIEKSDPNAARKAMAQLVDLALIDITTAPKWPRIIAGAKSAAAANTRPRARGRRPAA
jgi:DNA-binding FadR family transcriptional regulator